ncbi:hypothetical protein E6W39_00940 [Kitasatospora acidiphila]|uniref:Uncharacterized protein n=1 Tax=Kitasatospora acidiphila TaxID=2567942 RepID=A0A540WFZ3_9ACTN|nr:hypothetical protein [Kitasatospora acidiphila]TQF07935.1 hypothetical protein E6W39_00940 [Kitasatospora acidiphila]
MTNDSSGSAPFVAAPNGWRVAIGSPGESLIMLVPLVGWRSIPEGTGSIIGSALEPVVLFDNVQEPIISTVHDTLVSWDDRSYVHQVLVPGWEVRKVPAGWMVVEYGDQCD